MDCVTMESYFVVSVHFCVLNSSFLFRFEEYLLDHFPINQQVLADARSLNPHDRLNKNGAERVKRLMKELLDVVGEKNVNRALHFKDENATKYEMMDEVKRQYKEYQLETIPPEFTIVNADADAKSTHLQFSYWENAYKQLQMPDVGESKTNQVEERVDRYWVKVEEIFKWN